MPLFDKIADSFKRPENQSEKPRPQFNSPEFRLGIIALVLLFLALEDGSNSMLVTFLVVTGALAVLVLRKKYKQRKANPGASRDDREDGAQDDRAFMQDRDSMPEFDSVNSEDFTSRSGDIVDSWDIKDKKPPWEL